MSYREQLTPWVVLRLLPNMQRILLARFAKRSDADGYAQTWQRLAQAKIVVIFDPSQPALTPEK